MLIVPVYSVVPPWLSLMVALMLSRPTYVESVGKARRRIWVNRIRQRNGEAVINKNAGCRDIERRRRRVIDGGQCDRAFRNRTDCNSVAGCYRYRTRGCVRPIAQVVVSNTAEQALEIGNRAGTTAPGDGEGPRRSHVCQLKNRTANSASRCSANIESDGHARDGKSFGRTVRIGAKASGRLKPTCRVGVSA